MTVEWAFGSAVFAALFIVLRYVLRGRIGLRLQYALWGLLLLRFLVPVSIGSSAISIINALPEQKKPVAAPAPVSVNMTPVMEGSAAASGSPERTNEADGIPASSSDTVQVTAGPTEEKPVSAATMALDAERLLKIIWLLGAGLVFLWLLGVNIRFALRLRRSRRPYAARKDYPLPVYISKEAEASCLFGPFRPAVYLTSDAAESLDLDYILAHELTHYRHGDHIWSLLRGLALALHWFDPLAWWAGALSRRDGELACDEGTLCRLGDGERAEYGLALLRMFSARRSTLFRAATTMNGSSRGLKERIQLIAQKPGTTVRTLVFVILITALAFGCAFTGAKTAKPAPPARRSEDGRVILTIGAFQRDGSVNAENDQLSYTQLEKAVDRFNKENEEYFVEIRNYGDAASAEDMDKLNSEVQAGNMPDMLVTYGMSEKSYAKKGLLLDLYQWYGRERFFAGPLKSMETGGELYSVSSSIEVFSFYGLESVLGEMQGYGLNDVYRAWETFGTEERAFIPQLSGAYTFLILSTLRMDEWVDAASGTCRFDSPDFIALLEFCRKLPAEAVITQSETSTQGKLHPQQTDALCVKNKDALLGLVSVMGEVGSVAAQYADAMLPLDGERIVNVGIPGVSPAAAGCISELPIAVSARCGSPDGARAFLDSLWDLGYLQLHEGELRSIPLMRSVLEDHIHKNTFTGENGERKFPVGSNTAPCSEALLGEFLAMIESASIPVSLNSLSSVDPIILEEVTACFNDTQSAEQTAANIQDRYKLCFSGQNPS